MRLKDILRESDRVDPQERLYRGSVNSKEQLQRGDFAAVFLSRNRNAAAQYGEVSEWRTTRPLRLLTAEEAEHYVGEAMNDATPQDIEEETVHLMMFPTDDWARFITREGYDGTSMGDDIAVFDPSLLRSA